MNHRDSMLRRKKRGGLADEIHTWVVALVVFVCVVLPISLIAEYLT